MFEKEMSVAIDPIDGTKGYIRGDQYAVALGLIEDGEVVLGVLGCPNLPVDGLDGGDCGVILSACRGGGTFTERQGAGSRGQGWGESLKGGKAERLKAETGNAEIGNAERQTSNIERSMSHGERVERGTLSVESGGLGNLGLGTGERESRSLKLAGRGGGTPAPERGERETFGAGKQRVFVSGEGDPTKAVFCESVESAHTAHGVSADIVKALGVVVEPARIDSQCKYAVVARGDAGVYMRLPTRADYEEKIWDHAAGVRIVEEAGGRVTDVAGKPLDFSRGRTLRANKGVIVTNGLLHEAVLGEIGKKAEN